MWSAFFNSFHWWWSFDLWGKPVTPYLVGQPGRLLVGVCSSWHWMVSIRQSSVFRLLLFCNACTEAAVRSFSLLYLAFFPECVGKDTTLDPLYKMSPWAELSWAEAKPWTRCLQSSYQLIFTLLRRCLSEIVNKFCVNCSHFSRSHITHKNAVSTLSDAHIYHTWSWFH